MESVVIFSTLPLKSWSFSRNVKVRWALLTTTANIFPLMSRTVPCKTNSGMERHRLPVVQFEGAPPLSAARITLRNGSLRPKAPPREGVFLSGVTAVLAGAGGVLPAGPAGAGGLALAMAFLVELAAVLLADFADFAAFPATEAEPVLDAGVKVPVTTAGLAPAFPLFPDTAPEELVWTLLPGPAVPTPLLPVADGVWLTVLPPAAVF
jgi:hypothetical protein